MRKAVSIWLMAIGLGVIFTPGCVSQGAVWSEQQITTGTATWRGGAGFELEVRVRISAAFGS